MNQSKSLASPLAPVGGPTAAALAALITVGAGACEASTIPQCTVNADCASGTCLANGQCMTAGGADGGGGTDTSVTTRPAEAGPGVDAGSDTSVTPPPSGDAGGCMADDSGMIARDQLFYEPGLHATFLVADNVTVSTAGTTQPDGTRVWDYSGALSGDEDVIVQTLPLMGAWYASSFPGSGYASPLSHTEPLLGVFTAGQTALVLNGVVSETSGTMQTNLNYNPPATTLTFPIAMGATWQSTSTVSGTAEGIPSTYTEEYQSTVDAQGTVITPFGSFPVLRVVTVLTRTVAFIPTYTESFLFMTPCFGTVASITSQTSQANTGTGEFTDVAEIQRLAQ